jgi:hypothetical protein
MSEQGVENPKPAELTTEQWAAGREIAEYCGFGEDVLGQMMLWNGEVATVGYGLAHSAQYMDALTTGEIQTAVFNGIDAFQATVGNLGMEH